MLTDEESDQQSLTRLLKGVFAYSYSGYHVATTTMPADHVPEIGSYLERTRPATIVDGVRGWAIYDEIDGYVLVDYVGWIDFHGDGQLSGGGTYCLSGEHPVPFAHSGSYVIESALRPTLSREMIASRSVILTQVEAIRDAERELKFTVLAGGAGKLIASGTMVQA